MKPCPFCAEEIQDEALKCRFCGSILDKDLKKNEVKSQEKNFALSGKRHKSLTGCGGLLIIFIIIIVIIIITSSSTPNTEPQKINNQTNTEVQNNSAGVGENGILVSQNEEIAIPITKEYYDEMVKLSVANDTMGIAEMALDDKIFFVKTGTKVLVIDRETFSRQVRILEGENIGRSGWVPFEFIQRAQ